MFKMDLSKFKKVGSDKTHTTLQHSDGHTIKVAHAPLSPKTRGELHALPMAENKFLRKGEEKKIKVAEGGQIGSTKEDRDLVESLPDGDLANMVMAESSGKGTTSKEPPRKQEEDDEQEFAQGGQVLNPKLQQSKQQPSMPKMMADGGDTSPDKPAQAPVTINIGSGAQMPDSLVNPNPGSQSLAKAPVQKDQQSIDADAANAAGISPEEYAQMKQKAQETKNIVQSGQPETPLPGSPEAAIQDAQKSGGAAADVSLPPSPKTDLTATPQGPQTQQQAIQNVPIPDFVHGYQSQQQGLTQQAAAEGQMGREEAVGMDQGVKAKQQIFNEYQKQLAGLVQEYHNTRADVQNNLIKPNHYFDSLSTGQKALTIIGLIGGGMGGHGNSAIGALNSLVQRDIEAQKTNMGARENLLNATFKQMGNMKDAADMATSLQTGIIADKMKAAAARAQDPMAQARLLQAAGQLEQSVAPQLQQLAIRQSLMKINQQGGAAQTDPSMFVPYVVPKEQQEGAYKAISQAQNAVKTGSEIMNQFDVAASSPGKAIGIGPGAAAMKRMNALILPLIHDTEGRVNEFEQKTVQDLLPTPFDNNATLASKRQGLQDFISQKASASNLKGLGIDLSKFASTSHDPLTRLNPQVQGWVKWARENPQNPKAQMLLQKLGME